MDETNTQFLKCTSWRNMNFMNSYNLRIYEEDDVKEAKQILQGYKEIEQAKYEAEQKEKAGKVLTRIDFRLFDEVNMLLYQVFLSDLANML